MPQEVRRSQRVNLGVPPLRYSTVAQIHQISEVPTPAMDELLPTDSDHSSSEDDVNRTIRPAPENGTSQEAQSSDIQPQLQQTHPRTVHFDGMESQSGLSRPSCEMLPHPGLLCYSGLPPPFDQRMNCTTQRSSGLPHSTTMQPPPCLPHPYGTLPHPGANHSAQAPPLIGLPSQHAVQMLYGPQQIDPTSQPDLSQFRELPQSAGVMPPVGVQSLGESQPSSGLPHHRAPSTTSSAIVNDTATILALQRRILDLQREAEHYREVNATLELAANVYQRQGDFFDRTVNRRSTTSSQQSSDFLGFGLNPNSQMMSPSEPQQGQAAGQEPQGVAALHSVHDESSVHDLADDAVVEQRAPVPPTETVRDAVAPPQFEAAPVPNPHHQPISAVPPQYVTATPARNQMYGPMSQQQSSIRTHHVAATYTQPTIMYPTYGPVVSAPQYRSIASAQQYGPVESTVQYGATAAPFAYQFSYRDAYGRPLVPAGLAPTSGQFPECNRAWPGPVAGYVNSSTQFMHSYQPNVSRVHRQCVDAPRSNQPFNDVPIRTVPAQSITVSTSAQGHVAAPPLSQPVIAAPPPSQPTIAAPPFSQSTAVPPVSSHIAVSPSVQPDAVQMPVQPPPAPPMVRPVADYYVNTYYTSGDNATGTGTRGEPRYGTDAQRHIIAGADGVQGAAVNNTQLTEASRRDISNRRTHDLPIFSGRPEDWPIFICSYRETTQQFGYTDVENMLRLQKALTGEAKRRVRSILIRPEHVQKSLEALAKAFGRPQFLVESQLAEARRLPKISESQLDEMVQFSISVEGFVSFLDENETRHHLFNPTLLNELESKLPMSERLKWAAVARSIRPYPSIRDFALWLDESASLISSCTSYAAYTTYSSPPSRKREPKPPQPKSKHVLLSVADSTKKQTSERCSFCEEAHTIEHCNAFQKLTVPERFDECRRRPLCYGCLGGGHLLPSCEKKKECALDGCRRWHHGMLHTSADRPAPGTKPQPAHKRQIDRRRKPDNPRVQPNQPLRAAPPPPVVNRAESTSQRQQTPAAPRSSDSGNTSTVLSCQAGQSKQSLYFRVVPVILHGPYRSLQTFALLDEGSSVSLIDANLASELQLDGRAAELNLQFVSGQSSLRSSRDVRVGISSVEPEAELFNINSVQTVDELSLPAQTVDRAVIVRQNPHLSDVPFATYDHVRPKVLLGLEHHYLGVPIEIRTGARLRDVVAARTRLGWVLYGCCDRDALPGAIVLHTTQELDTEDGADRWEQLNELVRHHLTTEQFGVRVPSELIESDADKRARQILSTTTRRVGCRFETGLLWKRDDITLPDSYAMALRRLTSVESKMHRDPEYARQYRDQIRSYLEKGYARKMSQAEAAKRSERTWFLPHFAVRSANKPGKFRLVFDAAASVGQVSLNSMLLPGPDVNVPLTRLLFRFRLGRVAVCADVREMYHQVMVRDADQDAQRFLWRDGDSSAAPSVYVMRVMTFGSSCSPASAQHVKNQNATDHAEQFPDAANAIRRSHYVDDYVASFQTTEEAQRITADVIEVHSRGGFELRGVVSNCPEMRARFGGDVSANQSVVLEPEQLTQKILGMTWETGDDVFQFKTGFHRVRPEVIDGTCRPTKREMLSVNMSIFDPFGLLANFLLPSKTLIQELWRAGLQWDELVSEDINSRWQEWRAQVEQTRRVRIARCYSPSILTAPGLQLHLFADASEEAFAAVAYWRIQAEGGTELSFVAGKVRCAPIKPLSVPRLELQASLLAARLADEIRRSHEDLDITKTIYWSDSETVLKWLRCTQRRYKQFVAMRVAEIVETAPPTSWRWVPTALNVADDATRTRRPIVFDPDSRWLRGPSWLCGDEMSWPDQPTLIDAAGVTEEEIRSKFIGAVNQRGAVVNFARFSKFMRLVRAMAWALRFVANAQVNRDARFRGELTAVEVKRGTEAVCRMVQWEAFAEDVAALKSGRPIGDRSQIASLQPYLDDEGVLRLHGRTDAANEDYLSSAAKRPIIMPHEHYVSKLIVRHHHQLFAHQLNDATIASVRATFWIPKIRTLVKTVRHACYKCRARTVVPTPPMQGQLPRDRMEAYARPFTRTGLDYFGPIHVSVGRRREKRWVALFTCMTVRAVHLEIAADLTTDACLVCIRNLCHLRGVPATIRCDNGTNFVGACNELARDKTFFDPDVIQRELATRGVEWLFNCPGNPEAGGAWERLVQTVKRVLQVTLCEEAPRVETLRAMLLEAANLINSRPLTHLQVDPGDPDPLTPNHFLVGGPNVATAPNPKDVEPTATRRQWQICRGLSRRFWGQFVRDYLPELTRRGRHYPAEPPLQIGDIVIICDDQQPRNRWARGRIVEVATAADGMVRTAAVQTAHGILRRPATKLAKLIVSSSGGVDERGAVSPTGRP